MQSNQYEKLAARTTASPEQPADRLTQIQFQLALRQGVSQAIDAGNIADVLKRAIFYGDPKSIGRLPSGSEPVTPDAAFRLTNHETIELIHAGLGLFTEAAEFLHALYKNVFLGEPLDVENLREELGDSEWYIAKGAKHTGTNIAELFGLNIAKLEARYPEKFTESAALNRDLDAERAVLVAEPVKASKIVFHTASTINCPSPQGFVLSVGREMVSENQFNAIQLALNDNDELNAHLASVAFPTK